MGDLSLCGLLLEARADPERQSSAGAKAQEPLGEASGKEAVILF